MNQLPSEDRLVALIASVRMGDEAAFAVLLDRYAPLLQSLVSAFDSLLIGADELMQEARFALYRAAISYREGGVTFGLYAKICVRNQLVSRLRREQKEKRHFSLDALPRELPSDSDVDALDFLLRDESFCELCRQIARVLSPYEYRVFELYASGLSVAEIASELEKPRKSVQNALVRCLSKLRRAEWQIPGR
jgi:RNA polymerase sporulation-specific sigma factor